MLNLLPVLSTYSHKSFCSELCSWKEKKKILGQVGCLCIVQMFFQDVHVYDGCFFFLINVDIISLLKCSTKSAFMPILNFVIIETTPTPQNTHTHTHPLHTPTLPTYPHTHTCTYRTFPHTHLPYTHKTEKQNKC